MFIMPETVHSIVNPCKWIAGTLFVYKYIQACWLGATTGIQDGILNLLWFILALITGILFIIDDKAIRQI